MSNMNLSMSTPVSGEMTFPSLRSSEDVMRLRSVSMMKSARSTSVSRLAFFGKMSSLFAEASDQTCLEQPLCRDCFKLECDAMRKVRGVQQARLVTTTALLPPLSSKEVRP